MDNGEREEQDPNTLLKAWPDHLDEAIKILNWCLLPSLKFSPKELLLGVVVNTRRTEPEKAENSLTAEVVYVAQQHLDGYAEAVQHAISRKRVFDNRVLQRQLAEEVFKSGDLVQVY
ncbi:hypothetical protein BDN72DRAFT_781675 [Pluteus cervinus]|uniref:Uncharacterized protein n=1 Tax=Pluteus cervinus TaxID=181527 RepID=A0ACD2ZZ98_9AGAR|nr:hypothetical protein BDN72DRAFT_781675 [Pluteus cervinus]